MVPPGMMAPGTSSGAGGGSAGGGGGGGGGGEITAAAAGEGTARAGISHGAMGPPAPRAPRVSAQRTRGVLVWQQQSGCLYAAGDTMPVPLLRVWDMTRELCLESLQMQSPGTCLTAEGALLMAGAADGAVLSYDLRTPARLLSVIQTHQHPVVSILLQPGSTSNLVVTGSGNGEMKFCDLRNAAKPFFTTEVCQKPGTSGKTVLSALVAHSHAGVIASGSSERAIKLWDLEGNNVASIRYYNSFLGQRIGAVRSLAFHPNSLLLAAGSNDSIATVYCGEGSAAAGTQRA
jgi:regulator-associated protein of mTOR